MIIFDFVTFLLTFPRFVFKIISDVQKIGGTKTEIFVYKHLAELPAHHPDWTGLHVFFFSFLLSASKEFSEEHFFIIKMYYFFDMLLIDPDHVYLVLKATYQLIQFT